MPKRKRVQEILSSGEWRNVSFPKPFVLDGDPFEGTDPFEGLIEIEELTDYEIAPVSQTPKKIKDIPVVESDEPAEEIQPSKKKLRAEKRKEERRAAKQAAKANKLAAAATVVDVPEDEVAETVPEEGNFGELLVSLNVDRFLACRNEVKSPYTFEILFTFAGCQFD